jgi:hypothetical protein
MSAAQAEPELSSVDLAALESWLENLPNAAQRRRHEELADRAAGQLEVLSERLGTVSARLQSIQAGLVLLGLAKIELGAAWEDLQDGLRALPKIEISALASFAEGLGRTLPIQAERLNKNVEGHWRSVCDKRAQDIVAPLGTMLRAIAQGPVANQPKAMTIKLIVNRIKAARDAMFLDPGAALTFLAEQKVAQDYLAQALAGVPDPGTLVERLGAGELRLGELSENELDALRRSPLAHAISLKL